MSKIRESARDEQCLIRLPGICNGDPATTVLCHFSGGGMGTKRLDIHGAYGCSECHAAVDGGKTDIPKDRLMRWFYEGAFRTQERLIEKGLIRV